MDTETDGVIENVRAKGQEAQRALLTTVANVSMSLPVCKLTTKVSTAIADGPLNTSTRYPATLPSALPFWLRRITLSAFALHFMSIWISLFVLWHYNQDSDGFQLVFTSNHLSWTYGPTAIFVIIVSLRRQVDYHAKLSQPWKALLDGVSSAETTVLLDYLWPLQINSFIHATKNRHWTVVTSILVFTILKLVTLLSTGLLTTRPVETKHPTEVQAHTTFADTNFWPTVVQDDSTNSILSYNACAQI